MNKGITAPCGCGWRSQMITRRLTGILFPTAFVAAECSLCKEHWVERYEFDFSVPIDGRSFEANERETVKK